MKKEVQDLDRLRMKNPFVVPEGYMEGLTSQVMSRLPEKSLSEPKRVTMIDFLRPWLYLAAVFAGLGLFVNLLVGKSGSEKNVTADSLFVQTSIPAETLSAMQTEEDAEYLEYLEVQYVGYILAEEMGNYE
ncbi:MAG: hypothetical protein LBB84_04650 [Tannerellaceae bacterium]|jgi:hypothetical protein|nr:hypothetical protein [Tannerellaceae bacterium]